MTPRLANQSAFTENVKMFTVADKKMTFTEKVIHIAFACGCVRTFHVEHQATETRCAEHGDRMISTTEEVLPLDRAS
jgi:hypothetical protein